METPPPHSSKRRLLIGGICLLLWLSSYYPIYHGLVKHNMSRQVGMLGVVLALVGVAGVAVAIDLALVAARKRREAAGATGDQRKGYLISGLILGGLVLLLLHLGGYLMLREKEGQWIREHGEAAMAVITDVRLDITTQGADVKTFYSYVYHGATFKGKVVGDLGKVGDSIRVRFDPRAPADAFIE